jgi:hypothetical protein
MVIKIRMIVATETAFGRFDRNFSYESMPNFPKRDNLVQNRERYGTVQRGSDSC